MLQEVWLLHVLKTWCGEKKEHKNNGHTNEIDYHQISTNVQFKNNHETLANNKIPPLWKKINLRQNTKIWTQPMRVHNLAQRKTESNAQLTSKLRVPQKHCASRRRSCVACSSRLFCLKFIIFHNRWLIRLSTKLALINLAVCRLILASVMFITY